jgi:uncharacterized protein HemX
MRRKMAEEEKKEGPKEDSKKEDSTQSTMMTAFADLLKWAISTKSIWAILGVLVVGLVGSILAVVFVFKSRKLAEMQHKVNVAKEDLEQKKEDAKMKENEDERKKIEEEIDNKDKDLKSLEEDVKKLDEELKITLSKLESAKSWEELPK